MNNCHNSKELEALIGKEVIVHFTDGTSETGILRRSNFGGGYMIEQSDCNIRFYKSLVKGVASSR